MAHLRRPETKATLQRLSTHKSSTIAARAAAMLNTMEGGQAAPVHTTPPVRFRVFSNGKPLASEQVNCSYWKWKTVETDSDGFLSIPRDQFLDPETRGKLLKFSQQPVSDGRRISSPEDFNMSWVEVEAPVPVAFDETARIDFVTCEFPVEVHYGSPPPPAHRYATTFEISKAGAVSSSDWSYHLDFGGAIEPPMNFTLRRLQPGFYRLKIRAPGSTQLLSEPIEVKPGMAPFIAKLEKASDIFATLKFQVTDGEIGRFVSLRVTKTERQRTTAILG